MRGSNPPRVIQVCCPPGCLSLLLGLVGLEAGFPWSLLLPAPWPPPNVNANGRSRTHACPWRLRPSSCSVHSFPLSHMRSFPKAGTPGVQGLGAHAGCLMARVLSHLHMLLYPKTDFSTVCAPEVNFNLIYVLIFSCFNSCFRPFLRFCVLFLEIAVNLLSSARPRLPLRGNSEPNKSV